MKGLAELKNKIVKAPHLNIFKIGTWVTMGLFATFLLVYIFVGDEMLNYFPLLILFAFGSPFISLMTSKAMVKRAYNIRMKLVVDTITLLSQKLGLQKLPEIGVYPSNDINAFATGASKNSAMVAVSQGLLNSMNETEIIGVLAHEMSHVVNGDMLTSSILEGFVSAFGLIASLPFLMGNNNRGRRAASSMATYYVVRNIANFFGKIVSSAYSRRREFAADKLAAEITEPAYMKSALVRLQEISEGRISLQDSDREFASFKITNNFSMGNIFGSLFASHPSLEKRIEAIERMENKEL